MLSCPWRCGVESFSFLSPSLRRVSRSVMFWNMHRTTSCTRRDADFGWMPCSRSTSTPEKEEGGLQYSVGDRARGLLNVSIQSLHACCIEWRNDTDDGEMHTATQFLVSLAIGRCCWATVPVGHDLSQAMKADGPHGVAVWGGRRYAPLQPSAAVEPTLRGCIHGRLGVPGGGEEKHQGEMCGEGDGGVSFLNIDTCFRKRECCDNF